MYRTSRNALHSVVIKATRFLFATLLRSINILCAYSLEYRLTTTQISATPGVDYETRVVELQFSPGDSLESLDIPIKDDLVIEETETFRVTISSGDAQVRIVDPQSIIVTIIDTDGTLLD